LTLPPVHLLVRCTCRLHFRFFPHAFSIHHYTRAGFVACTHQSFTPFTGRTHYTGRRIYAFAARTYTCWFLRTRLATVTSPLPAARVPLVSRFTFTRCHLRFLATVPGHILRFTTTVTTGLPSTHRAWFFATSSVLRSLWFCYHFIAFGHAHHCAPLLCLRFCGSTWTLRATFTGAVYARFTHTPPPFFGLVRFAHRRVRRLHTVLWLVWFVPVYRVRILPRAHAPRWTCVSTSFRCRHDHTFHVYYAGLLFLVYSGFWTTHTAAPRSRIPRYRTTRLRHTVTTWFAFSGFDLHRYATVSARTFAAYRYTRHTFLHLFATVYAHIFISLRAPHFTTHPRGTHCCAPHTISLPRLVHTHHVLHTGTVFTFCLRARFLRFLPPHATHTAHGSSRLSFTDIHTLRGFWTATSSGPHRTILLTVLLLRFLVVLSLRIAYAYIVALDTTTPAAGSCTVLYFVRCTSSLPAVRGSLSAATRAYRTPARSSTPHYTLRFILPRTLYLSHTRFSVPSALPFLITWFRFHGHLPYYTPGCRTCCTLPRSRSRFTFHFVRRFPFLFLVVATPAVYTPRWFVRFLLPIFCCFSATFTGLHDPPFLSLPTFFGSTPRHHTRWFATHYAAFSSFWFTLRLFTLCVYWTHVWTRAAPHAHFAPPVLPRSHIFTFRALDAWEHGHLHHFLAFVCHAATVQHTHWLRYGSARVTLPRRYTFHTTYLLVYITCYAVCGCWFISLVLRAKDLTGLPEPPIFYLLRLVYLCATQFSTHVCTAKRTRSHGFFTLYLKRTTLPRHAVGSASSYHWFSTPSPSLPWTFTPHLHHATAHCRCLPLQATPRFTTVYVLPLPHVFCAPFLLDARIACVTPHRFTGHRVVRCVFTHHWLHARTCAYTPRLLRIRTHRTPRAVSAGFFTGSCHQVSPHYAHAASGLPAVGLPSFYTWFPRCPFVSVLAAGPAHCTRTVRFPARLPPHHYAFRPLHTTELYTPISTHARLRILHLLPRCYLHCRRFLHASHFHTVWFWFFTALVRTVHWFAAYTHHAPHTFGLDFMPLPLPSNTLPPLHTTSLPCTGSFGSAFSFLACHAPDATLPRLHQPLDFTHTHLFCLLRLHIFLVHYWFTRTVSSRFLDTCMPVCLSRYVSRVPRHFHTHRTYRLPASGSVPLRTGLPSHRTTLRHWTLFCGLFRFAHCFVLAFTIHTRATAFLVLWHLCRCHHTSVHATTFSATRTDSFARSAWTRPSHLTCPPAFTHVHHTCAPATPLVRSAGFILRSPRAYSTHALVYLYACLHVTFHARFVRFAGLRHCYWVYRFARLFARRILPHLSTRLFAYAARTRFISFAHAFTGITRTFTAHSGRYCTVPPVLHVWFLLPPPPTTRDTPHGHPHGLRAGFELVAGHPLHVHRLTPHLRGFTRSVTTHAGTTPRTLVGSWLLHTSAVSPHVTTHCTHAFHASVRLDLPTFHAYHVHRHTRPLRTRRHRYTPFGFLPVCAFVCATHLPRLLPACAATFFLLAFMPVATPLSAVYPAGSRVYTLWFGFVCVAVSRLQVIPRLRVPFTGLHCTRCAGYTPLRFHVPFAFATHAFPFSRTIRLFCGFILLRLPHVWFPCAHRFTAKPPLRRVLHGLRFTGSPAAPHTHAHAHTAVGLRCTPPALNTCTFRFPVTRTYTVVVCSTHSRAGFSFTSTGNRFTRHTLCGSLPHHLYTGSRRSTFWFHHGYPICHHVVPTTGSHTGTGLQFTHTPSPARFVTTFTAPSRHTLTHTRTPRFLLRTLFLVLHTHTDVPLHIFLPSPSRVYFFATCLPVVTC